MKKNTIYLAILLVLAIIVGCNQSENTAGVDRNDFSSNTLSNEANAKGELDYAVAPSQTVAADASSVGGAPIKMPDKIIKTGNMLMVVEAYDKALAQIMQQVKTKQGYISNQNEQRSDYEITNTLVIRVASQHFDGLMNGLGQTAHKLLSKNVYMQDVSEEYTDVVARLKTKREVELRYLDILRTAKTIEDILAVEEQLRTIREEIESATARLKYMDDQVSYSTITVEIIEKLDYNAPAPMQDGFGNRLLNGLTNGWNSMLAMIIGLVNVWPLMLVLGGVLFLLYRRLRARKLGKNV